jgi:hypothetical protein
LDGNNFFAGAGAAARIRRGRFDLRARGMIDCIRAVKLTQQALLLLLLAFSAGARGDEFTDRCAGLPQQVKVDVVFQDRDVMTDVTRNVQELNRIAAKPAGDHHNVYGVTHAKPTFRLTVTPRAITDGGARFCATPDIAIELGFSDFVVYLAKELTDPCRRDIIRQHEQEHVNTWKAHLRASAQLLAAALRRNIGEARFYASREETEAGVRAWSEALVGPWAKRILDSVTAAQGAIDTPVSYGIVTSRLRTCGQAVRGGSR